MSIRVFLADDHAVVRDGLRLLLEAQNDITIVGDAADGRQAVRQVQKLKPDVVVMDLAMPELNGIEAARQIQSTCPGIRVVILSMYSSKEYILQALEAGVRGYLLKESAGREVVAAVRSVYSNQRYLSANIKESILNSYLDQRQSNRQLNPVQQLSSREREILQLVVEGRTSAQIAATLFLSPKTVETYRSRLMTKLEIKNIPGLVKFAIRHGITKVE